MPESPEAQDLSFEDALQRLEDIVEHLETETPDLQDALDAYEEGVGLAGACLERLEAAEQKVEELGLEDG